MDENERKARAAALDRMAKAGLVKMVACDTPEDAERLIEEMKANGNTDVHLIQTPEDLEDQIREVTDPLFNGSTKEDLVRRAMEAEDPADMVKKMAQLWLYQTVNGEVVDVLRTVATYSKLLNTAQQILASHCSRSIPAMDSKHWPHYVVLVSIRPITEDFAGISVSYILRGRVENVPEVLGNHDALMEIVSHAAKMSVYLSGVLTTEILGSDEDLNIIFDEVITEALKGAKDMPSPLGDRSIGGFQGFEGKIPEEPSELDKIFGLDVEPTPPKMTDEMRKFAEEHLSPEELDYLRRTEDDDNPSH